MHGNELVYAGVMGTVIRHNQNHAWQAASVTPSKTVLIAKIHGGHNSYLFGQSDWNWQDEDNQTKRSPMKIKLYS